MEIDMEIPKQEVKRKYTVGFIFNFELNKVILLRKTHPKWQRNRLNGIGGQVEECDQEPGYSGVDSLTFRNCMVREAAEETGIGIHHWVPVCTIYSHDVAIKFYTTVLDNDRYEEILDKRANNTGESFVDVPLSVLHAHDTSMMISDLRWLIPLAKYQFINFDSQRYYVDMSVYEDSVRPE